MNKDIKKYLKELKALLPVHGKLERQFVSGIKASILEVAEDSSDITYDFLCREFGKPQDIIISYFSEIDHDYLRNRLRIASIVRKSAIILVAAVILFVVYRAILVYDSYLDAKDAVITEEVTVIEK